MSSAGEWDDYEWSWTGSLTEWALRPDTDPCRPCPRPRRRRASTAGPGSSGYRGELGFLTAVLARAR